MIQIRKEAEDIISGKQPKDNNLLKNAPHPLSVISLSEEEWNRCALFAVTLYAQGLIRLQSLLPPSCSIPYAMAPREEVLANCLSH